MAEVRGQRSELGVGGHEVVTLLHSTRPGYSRSLTRQRCAAWRRASSRDASGSFWRTASSRYVASYTDVRPCSTESLMSRSVNGLNPRRLAIKERPARSSATACQLHGIDPASILKGLPHSPPTKMDWQSRRPRMPPR